MSTAKCQARRAAGPRRIVDLDVAPERAWPLREDTLYVYLGRLWHLEPVQCAVCAFADTEDPLARVLGAEDEDDRFTCLRHGALDNEVFELRREYTITLAGLQRSGGTVETSFVLFPRALSPATRSRQVERILDEGAQAASDGPEGCDGA